MNQSTAQHSLAECQQSNSAPGQGRILVFILTSTGLFWFVLTAKNHSLSIPRW